MVFAQPAAAAFLVKPDGSVSVTSGTAVGATQIIQVNGVADQNVIAGLTSALTLTFQNFSTASGKSTYTFGYSLFNSSEAPVTASVIKAFGFDLNPTYLSSTVTGAFTKTASGPISNALSVDLCFKNGQTNNCAGGGNGGIVRGASGAGTFTLTFAGAPTPITFSGLTIRYQGIDSATMKGGSAVGYAIAPNVGAIPEPATWALFILGFGAVGGAMRNQARNKQTTKASLDFA